jgi:predicted TIM-barrel fold metal-dependent hydrolase
MAEFEVIDAHVHMARNSSEETGWYLIPGRRDRDRWATPEGSIPWMDRNGISKMVVLVLLPRTWRPSLNEKARIEGLPSPERVEAEKKMVAELAPKIREFNEWGCQLSAHFPRLVPFILIAKDLGGAAELAGEVALRFRQGAKGVKLHPGMHGFYPDDETHWPMYAKCQELGLPVVADSGPWEVPNILIGSAAHLHQPHPDYGEPKNFEKVLKTFPRLTLVMAHLGSAWWDERVELAAKYPNLYFDISQGFAAPDRIPFYPLRGLAEEDAPRILRKIGVARIMFGSDGPSLPFQLQLEQLLRLPLTDDEKRRILAENAKRIYRI